MGSLHLSRYRSFVVMAAFFCAMPAVAAPVSVKPGTQPSSKTIKKSSSDFTAPKTQPAQSAKVKGLLEAIRRANSLQDINKAHEKAKLSRQEKTELRKALQKQPYKSKLKALEKKASQTPTMKMAGPSTHRASADRNRQNAQTRLAKTKAERKSFLKDAGFRSVAPGTMGRARSFVADDENPASLRNIQPRALIPGKEFTLTGENLGSAPGNVDLLILEMAVACRIVTWGSEQIVARVPANAQSLLVDEDVSGLIWVKPHGSTLGPTTEVALRPDRERMVPEFVSVEPGEITPGVSVIISGNNFLSQNDHSVANFVFRTQAITEQGIIEHWDNNTIVVRLRAGADRLRAAPCELYIRNHFGKSSTYTSLNFSPTLVRQTLRKENFLGSNSSATFVNFESPLLRDWKVVGSYRQMELPGVPIGGPYPSCEYVEQPEAGSSSARSVLRIDTPEEGGCNCFNYVIIEGPAGLSHE